MARFNFEAFPRALNASGNPASGAKMYVYEAGTTKTITTYSDDEMTVAHASPIIANANGFFPQVYVPEGLAYKVRVTTSTGTLIYEADNIDQGYTSLKFPILMAMFGQSNAASTNAQAAGGDLTADSRILFWNGSAFVKWTPATGMGVGASGRNSILFQAAKEAIRQGYPKVYCVVDAHAGKAISWWVGSGAASSGYVSLKGQMDAAIADGNLIADGVSKLESVIWAQGESDGGGTFDVDTYAANFETLKAQLRAESWFDADTPITCLEMPTIGSATIVNRYFVSTLPFDADPYTTTTRTEGLDDGADNTHWTGTAMNTIGARCFKTILGQINQALPRASKVDAEFLHIRLEGVFGKGLGAVYGPINDQVIFGGMSDNTSPAIVSPTFTFDLDDNWVRSDTLHYFNGGLEMLSGLTLESYLGSNFTDISHAVNTDPNKKAGTAYWDSANNRLVVANGTGAAATWSYIAATGTYTPA